MGIKYQVNESFFTAWSREMAYVLGYLYADGSLEDAYYLRGKYTRVTSTDRLTVFRIRKLLNSKHTINILKPDENHPGKTRYFLRIGSHALYDSLVALGLHPHKSLTVTFPSVPRKFLADFIRGYFDGDGCAHLSMAKGITQKKIIKRLCVTFTSGSFDFLKKLCHTLKTELPLQQDKIYKGSRSFQLKYSTGDSVEIFKFMYGSGGKELRLERKFKVFADYFKLRPQRVDVKINSLLKSSK